MSASVATKASTLKIHCDGDIFLRQRHGGVRRSTECLVQGLARRAAVEMTVHFEAEHIGPMPDIAGSQSTFLRPAPRLRPARVFSRLNRAMAQSRSRSFWRGMSDGAYLSTYYTTRDSLRIPQVSVIHDMIFEMFPYATVGERQQQHKRDKQRAIEAADLLVCPSQSACDDLGAVVPSAIGRSCVIPWGVETWFRPDEDAARLMQFRRQACNGAPYLLYVGGRSGTKNFAALLIAYSRWRSRKEFALLSVGGGAFSNEENCLLRALGVEGSVHSMPSLDNAALVTAYSGAMGCVMPSLYEGFGFPVAESLACGTPVACARVSSLPEVGGAAAIYFDPCNQDELLFALDLLAVTDRNDGRLLAGFERARARDWDVVAAEFELRMRSLA